MSTYKWTFSPANGLAVYVTDVAGLFFAAIAECDGSFCIMGWYADIGAPRSLGNCPVDKRSGKPRAAAFTKLLTGWYRYHGYMLGEEAEVTL